MEALADISGLAPSLLAAASLIFLRVGAMMALLPVFGERMIPMRIRLVLSIAFTAILIPSVGPTMVLQWESDTSFIKLAAIEVLAGLALGIALRLIVIILQISGTIAAQSTSLSQLFGGAAVDPQPAIGFVLVLGGLTLATVFNLHVKIAVMLIVSYNIFQPGQVIFGESLASWGVEMVASAMLHSVVLAGPFLIASLVYNLALGVINRAMPQLMVAFVGAPAITFGALAILALASPLILSTWIELLDQRISNLFGKH